MTAIATATTTLPQANIGGRIVAGRVGAEVGSLLLATRLVPLVERIAPHRYDRLKTHLAHAIEPHLAWYEAHLLSLPAFDAAAQKADAAPDAAAKAKVVASAMVDFATMTAGAMIGQVATQGVLNKLTGLRAMKNPGSQATGWRSGWEQARNLGVPVAFDKLVNMSLVGLMQYGVPTRTQSVTDDTSSLLQRTLGIPPETTQYFLQWGLPHLAGAATSTLMMRGKYQDIERAIAAAAVGK